MQASMVTMALQLEGHQIEQTLGVVRGIVVRSRSVFGTIGAALQTIRGGNITLMTELCERTRAEAFAQMIFHAEELGANRLQPRPSDERDRLRQLDPPVSARRALHRQATVVRPALERRLADADGSCELPGREILHGLHGLNDRSTPRRKHRSSILPIQYARSNRR